MYISHILKKKSENLFVAVCGGVAVPAIVATLPTRGEKSSRGDKEKKKRRVKRACGAFSRSSQRKRKKQVA